MNKSKKHTIKMNTKLFYKTNICLKYKTFKIILTNDIHMV